MCKVICICGKICSGKSYYAKRLAETEKAVILSTDEVTYDLIDNKQGEFYDAFAKRVNNYLKKKAVEIVKAGANVILDWGFWTKPERNEISQYFNAQKVLCEWHYIDADDDTWHKNIAERNRLIESGNGKYNFYVDDGLINKLLSKFEVPERDEIDIWYENRYI